MPTLILATLVTIFCAGLFGYLRYLAYLRTMRWIIEQFGPDSIGWATALSPRECEAKPHVALIRRDEASESG